MPIGVPRVPFRLPGDPYAQWVDLYNRLYRERVLFLGSDIDDELSNQLVGIISYLALSEPDKRTFLYINSMGGSVSAGLGIFDCIQYVSSPVQTACVGLAASMASLILAGGERGTRLILPHARVMLHQPSGGAEGQASEVALEAQEILRLRVMIGRLYNQQTGQPLAQLADDLDRDYYMNAEQAREYGLVDAVLVEQKKNESTAPMRWPEGAPPEPEPAMT